MEERTSFLGTALFSSESFTHDEQAGEPIPPAVRDMLVYLSRPVAAILVLLGLAVLLGPSLIAFVIEKRVLSPPEKTSDRAFLAAAFLACLALGLSLNAFVFEDYRITPDENNYLDFARTLSHGKLFGEAPPLPEFFDEPYFAHKDGRLFIIFQAGWSLLLTPSVLLGIQRAMPALTGALALLATFLLARRLAGRGVARGSVLIMLLSPYFVFYTATYYSHIAGLMWISFFGLFFVLAREEKRSLFYLLAGGCLGAAFLTRYFDLVVGFPFGLLLLWDLLRREQGGWKNLFLFCAPLFLCGCLAVLYQWLSTGDLSLAPFELYCSQSRYLYIVSQFSGPEELFGFSSHHTPVVAIKMLFKRILTLNYWIFPFALVFLLPVLIRPGRWVRVLLLGCLCLFLVYLLYAPPGGWEYGPRYYLPVYGFLAISLATGIGRTFSFVRKKWGEKRVLHGLAYGFLLCLVLNICLAITVSVYLHRWVHGMTDHVRLLEEQDIREGIVFVKTKPDFFIPRFQDKESTEQLRRDIPFYLIRNRMDFRQPLLFAHSLGEEDRRLMSRFPDRTFYLIEADPVAAFYGVGRAGLQRLQR